MIKQRTAITGMAKVAAQCIHICGENRHLLQARKQKLCITLDKLQIKMSPFDKQIV